jgi:lipooligosaccharide transport system permease protein
LKNINQFQTVYSFLISPMYFLSGIFFPVHDRPVLSIVAQFSPFYHGVVLMQHTGWGTLTLGQFAYHAGLLLAFTTVLIAIAQVRVRKLLIN